MAGVTIKDVARAANVSVATVSRALNGHDNVTDEMRRRVAAIAEQMHYSPHAAARSLSSRRTHAIGVVLPDLYGEFFSELVRGIDQVAREHRLHLLVSSYHGHREEQGAAMRAMRGRVDGLLVMSPYAAGSAALDGGAAGLPLVLINSQDAGEGAVALGVDNYAGAVAMVEHLVACGHRRIAFIAGPDDNFDAYQRQRGYRDALARLLPDARPLELPGDFSESSGHVAGVELLARSPRPDAVFAANDMMAIGAMLAFQEAGVRCPDDVAVVGFDDVPVAALVRPSLTTLRIRIADTGRGALNRLVGLINGDADAGGPDEVVRPELVTRQSTDMAGASDRPVAATAPSPRDEISQGGA